MIRVSLPFHLRSLANVEREVKLEVAGEPTFAAVLEELESQYPMLQGTIRDHVSKERRPFIRFFACGQDFSHQPTDTPLPDCVRDGREPLRIVGAMSGG
ncbi:MAG: hypothetical protein BGO78_05185 [Chloroflexi bacterium 44-23]|nr:MAG: hypothetical protein BGO78_05185 [Chloroflexi bacterium 44-23]